jgi:cytidylate kinase
MDVGPPVVGAPVVGRQLGFNDTTRGARRRLLEREGSEPTAAEVADEVARLTERDRVDMERTASPLRQPDDAVVIDTTDLTMAEQIGRIVTLARAAGGGRTA